jgi:hypothetical protein
MIAVVTVKLAPAALMGEFYFQREFAQSIALRNYASYEIRPCFAVDAQGEAAAEEVFDLSNNPFRQDEREQLYGNGRSVSVGDIVEVDGVNYLCAPTGWTELVDAFAE